MVARFLTLIHIVLELVKLYVSIKANDCGVVMIIILIVTAVIAMAIDCYKRFTKK